MYLLSEDLFTFTNSVDPDEMQHYSLVLHCLKKYSFRGFANTRHSMLGHHRPASVTPFKWCFAGGSIMG